MIQTKLLNRQLRTRKDLLQAAARLLKNKRTLNMDEVAKEALVSRATAYRYFSDINDLIAEVGIDETLPDPKDLFRDASQSTIAERVGYAESVLHDFVYKNENQLRQLLSRLIINPKVHEKSKTAPARQNRRNAYIQEALAPFRNDFDTKTFKMLIESFALVFGPESMIVFKDVLAIGELRAREVKRWIIASLIEVALKENRKRKK